MHARLDRWALVAALVGVPLVAAALIPLRGHIENTNIALILVVVVVAVACSGNRLAAALAALSAAFWFDFFFTVPFNSPTINSGEDALSAVLLLVVGLTVGQLAVWARRQADAARQGRADIGRIHRAADLASRGESADRVVAAVAAQLREVLDLRDCRFDAGPADPLLARIDTNGEVWWGEMGWATDSLGLPAKGVTLEVAGGGRVLGTYTLTPTPGELVEPDRLVVAVALAHQAGAALSGFQTDLTRSGCFEIVAGR